MFLPQVRDRRTDRERTEKPETMGGGYFVFVAKAQHRMPAPPRRSAGKGVIAHQQPDVAAYRKLDEVPFDFERRLSLKRFHASPSLFHNGWLVESLTTQALVLFVIRTVGNPLCSRPSLPLALATVGIVLVG
jgi:hypothetical protein